MYSTEARYDTTAEAFLGERTYQILTAMDFTELSNVALEQAIALSTHHPHAKLHVITVGSPKDDGVVLPGSHTATKQAAAVAKGYVMDQVARYEEDHGPIALDQVAVYVAVGKPAARILSLARFVDADVIVMGTRSRQGISRLFEGSVAEEVVRQAECGVYVVHESTRRPPDRSIPPPPAEIDVVFDGEKAG